MKFSVRFREGVVQQQIMGHVKVSLKFCVPSSLEDRIGDPTFRDSQRVEELANTNSHGYRPDEFVPGNSTATSVTGAK